MRYIFFILLISVLGKAQSRDEIIIDDGQRDSVRIFRPSIKDYQYYTQFSEKKVFDTVFTIDKSYQFTQYNLQDNFGRIPFSNIGNGFQQLVYKANPEQDLTLLPTKKSFFILGIKDVKYYDIKTPTTVFRYLNGMNDGGMLQTTYTQNVGKNFNFALEYMGLRSRGYYQRNLTASNHAVFSVHYLSKNKKYEAFAHYLHQNVLNEENGGIESFENFIGGDSRFNNRQNLLVNLHRTHSRFFLRRFYLSHYFTPFDAEKYPFKIKHTAFHQKNEFHYTQESTERHYPSEVFAGYPTHSNKIAQKLSNTFSLAFDKEKFKLEAGLQHQNIRYTLEPNAVIQQGLRENRFGIIGNLKMKLWDKIAWISDLEISKGKVLGYYLNSENKLILEPIKGYLLNAHLNFKSHAPSLNYLLNASFYKEYNYYFNDFKNQNTLEIGADVQFKRFDAKLFANYFILDQMSYFDALAKPKQSISAVNIAQIGGEATFNYRKFHLNTKVLLQNVLNNKNLLPLPQILARANFYYQNKMFKNVAEIQTGVKAYYFSKFASREYFPILNEFILPSDTHFIGGQPIADIYFNFKVKRMMVYIEAQHINTTFMKNQSFAAPYYPVADFRLNLGLIWYLFH
ncbi:MAG: hypothetical protein Q4A00_04925 [Flavobacteriaceae bacterium]|nr:hypothetical protein [Flavobacteriaceae bacterium]